MAVRNFWIRGNVDGRKTIIEGGPRSKDGGMDITILMRDEGEIVEAFSILCRAVGSDPDNPILQVTVNNHDGLQVAQLRKYR